MNIKGAIFDLDGTLVDSLFLWDILWKKLGAKYLHDESFRPDNITEKAVRTLSLKDAMHLVYNNCKIGESGDGLLRDAEEMIEHFYAEEVELKDGVKEFLHYAKSKGIKMCVASATAPYFVKLALAKCGIDDLFDGIVSCTEVGKSKEHPDVFIAAQKYMGTTIDETWVFEDSIVSLQTATRAGFKTVGIYDKLNFNIENIPEFSTEYIGDGDSLARLIDKIK